MSSNAANLAHSLQYLEQVVKARFAMHFGTQPPDEAAMFPALGYYDDTSAFGNFVKARQPTVPEYVVLLLALAPHIQPNFLERVIKETLPDSGDFPELGGARDRHSRGFVPTGETALFLLAGDDLDQRFEVQRLFTTDHWFAREGVLHLEPAREGEPYWSGRLLLSPEYIELFTLGQTTSPSFSATFPAREITTEMEWPDLILAPEVKEQIDDLKQWIEHQATLRDGWGMGRKLRPGYRVLFYGPPGTGKTLTATLLGKYTGRKVFRIDLSTVVSKFIGETEKNLANLFDRAHHKQWILFFDEADALFGKRTTVKDAHDRFANQEVSYLLQRVEEFDGLVVLASNFKSNMDDAFLRRFNAIIRFPFPDETERVAIWRASLPAHVEFEDGVDLPARLGRFELTGGSIINVVQHACIAAITRGSTLIRLDDALCGIQREVEKEGKVFRNVLETASERH